MFHQSRSGLGAVRRDAVIDGQAIQKTDDHVGLAILSSASVSAAPAFALIVVSAMLFLADPSGRMSSVASATSFVGAVAGGLIGVHALRHFTVQSVAVTLALCGGATTLAGHFLGQSMLLPLLVCILVVNLVQAVDVAITMQAIEHHAPSVARIRTHAKHQLILTLSTLAAPAIAGVAALVMGIHALLFVTLSYTLSLASWMRLISASRGLPRKPPTRFGFRDLFSQAPLRRLTFFRLQIGCALAATFVALPLLSARISTPETAGLHQAVFMLVAAVGFSASYFFTSIRNYRSVPPFSFAWIGCVGSALAWIAIALTDSLAVGVVACFANGYSVHCLRMAAVMIGRLVTASSDFGGAVLAGDTIARLVSATVALLLSLHLVRERDSTFGAPTIFGIALLSMSALLLARKLWSDAQHADLADRSPELDATVR